jgi:hypothetical protein
MLTEGVSVRYETRRQRPAVGHGAGRRRTMPLVAVSNTASTRWDARSDLPDVPSSTPHPRKGVTFETLLLTF